MTPPRPAPDDKPIDRVIATLPAGTVARIAADGETIGGPWEEPEAYRGAIGRKTGIHFFLIARGFLLYRHCPS